MEREYTQKYLQIARQNNKNVVFEAKETPFFSVKPELSSLAQNEFVKNQFESTFPLLSFEKACLADGAILIQDTTPSINRSDFIALVEDLNNASNITMQVVDAEALSSDLSNQLVTQNLLFPDQVILVPGNGAKGVFEQLQRTNSDVPGNIYTLPTQRTLIKPGKFDIDINFSSLPKVSELSSVLIIDDVVASGQTANTIAEELLYRNPELEINIGTWIYLWPNDIANKKTPSGIKNVTATSASIALKGNYYGRPPINSLSCLLQDDPLSQQKTDTYISKYANDPLLFRQILTKLKEAL